MVSFPLIKRGAFLYIYPTSLLVGDPQHPTILVSPSMMLGSLIILLSVFNSFKQGQMSLILNRTCLRTSISRLPSSSSFLHRCLSVELLIPAVSVSLFSSQAHRTLALAPDLLQPFFYQGHNNLHVISFTGTQVFFRPGIWSLPSHGSLLHGI